MTTLRVTLTLTLRVYDLKSEIIQIKTGQSV